MPERQLILAIDAGPNVADATRDQITAELLQAIHDHCGADSAEPAERLTQPGEKGALTTALVGSVIVYIGKKLGDALLSELGKALWNWLKQMRTRFNDPVRVSIPTANGATITIVGTPDLTMDDVIKTLREWVETPE